MSNTNDFMLEEYRQIAKAYGDLHTQKNDLLRYYIAIIGAGASVITLLSKITENEQNVTPVNFIVAIGLLSILLSLIGLIIFLSVIGVRIEMILYVRTINALRAFFVEKDKIDQKDRDLLIKNFLVLPDYDENTPPFRESYMTSFFWVIILIGLINSVIFVTGLYMVTMKMIIPPFSFFFFAAIHYAFYYGMTSHMESKYIVKRKEPKKREEKGTIVYD